MPELRVNGLTIRYEWHGPTEGPVLVLINGLLTDLTSWSQHLSALTGAWRVLTYDCRGQGGSDKPEEGPAPGGEGVRRCCGVSGEVEWCRPVWWLCCSTPFF